MGYKVKNFMPEATLTFAGVTAAALLKKRTVQSLIRSQFRKLTTGSTEKQYRTVPETEEHARQIINILKSHNITPKLIAIDGLPGSGKSTLGRSLAKNTGLKWRTLYWKELRERFIFRPGYVYENIRLIRTQNLRFFDAIIYLSIDPLLTRQRIIDRDRNGTLADTVDFKRMKKVGDLAFNMLNGEVITIPHSPISIKLKPQSGFHDHKNILHALKSHNINTNPLSKEAKLQAICFGKSEDGILSYFNKTAYQDEIIKGMKAAIKRGIAIEKLL
ncbi:MAG: hypothetical protein HQK83_01900 [Fibrobacteria bacterium]|nr:hypothetical protein [Fibrobacteria bacterium]